MKENFYKLWKLGKANTIYAFVVISLCWLGSIVMMIFGYLYIALIFTGGFFCLIFTALFLHYICGSIYVKIGDTEVAEVCIGGRIKKANDLKDLKELRIIVNANRSITEYYICFNFSLKDVSKDVIRDLNANENVILLQYTKENEAIVRRFSELPILNKEIMYGFDR